MYVYMLLYLQSAVDDGQLDTAIHHPPAQVQQQHGKYHNSTKMFGLHRLTIIPALATWHLQTWKML